MTHRPPPERYPHYEDEYMNEPVWFMAIMIVMLCIIIVFEWLMNYGWWLAVTFLAAGLILKDFGLSILAALVITILVTAVTEYAYSQGVRLPWRREPEPENYYNRF